MSRAAILLFTCIAIGLFAAPALAQGQQKGSGSIRLEYQYIYADKFLDDVAEYDYWTTDTHVLMLSGNYAITDRWNVVAALPYIQKRFNSEVPWGGDPHNPNDPYWIDYVPTDKRFVDDGEYHGGFQDFSVGISYLALDGPFSISPYIGYGVPTDNYPFFAKAAIGTNLWNVPVGATFTYIPYFSDWYFSGNLAYVFSEKPLGINVDHWNVQLSAGYWFKPNFSVNVFAGLKYVREGLQMPWDFTDDPTYANYPDEFDTEEWYNHDRLIAHRNLNVGVGLDYFVNRDYKLSLTGFTGVWAEQSTVPAYAFTLGLTRYFGNE